MTQLPEKQVSIFATELFVYVPGPINESLVRDIRAISGVREVKVVKTGSLKVSTGLYVNIDELGRKIFDVVTAHMSTQWPYPVELASYGNVAQDAKVTLPGAPA